MKRNNYIVCEFGQYSQKWCLHCVCGQNFETAKKSLAAARQREPGKRFCIQTIPEKDCWWKDPTNF